MTTCVIILDTSGMSWAMRGLVTMGPRHHRDMGGSPESSTAVGGCSSHRVVCVIVYDMVGTTGDTTGPVLMSPCHCRVVGSLHRSSGSVGRCTSHTMT